MNFEVRTIHWKTRTDRVRFNDDEPATGAGPTVRAEAAVDQVLPVAGATKRGRLQLWRWDAAVNNWGILTDSDWFVPRDGASYVWDLANPHQVLLDGQPVPSVERGTQWRPSEEFVGDGGSGLLDGVSPWALGIGAAVVVGIVWFAVSRP